MCKQCVIDLERWMATGELPEAWKPEPVTDEFDAQVDEINRDMAEHFAELDAELSGSAEPPRGGWLSNLSRYGEP